MYVCMCAAVTDTEVRASVRAGARCLEDVAEECAAGTGCGSCHERIDTILATTPSPDEAHALPRIA